MPRERRTPSLGALFGHPFAEAAEALARRLEERLPTRTWRDVLREQHDRAFVVAGVTEAALLDDLAEAVQAAIRDGESLEQFRDRFMRAIEQHGWTGFRGDTGPQARAWRTRVIYATNMAVSYAAGRRKQLIEGGFRFWIYRHSHLSADPRPEHLEWDGTALPPDDPWWETHYPPNGWGCRCYVVGAMSEAQARRRGATRFTAPTAPGDTRGIDEGWDYAPGASVQLDVRALYRPALARLRDQALAAQARQTVEEQVDPAEWITPAEPATRAADRALQAGTQIVDGTLDQPVSPQERQELGELVRDGETWRQALDRWANTPRGLEGYQRVAVRLRRQIVDQLRSTRVYGEARPALAGDDEAEVERVSRAVMEALPSDWIAAVAARATVTRIEGRDYYRLQGAELGLNPRHARAPVTAVHEWLHHLQAHAPQLQAVCEAEHARRTAGEPLVPVSPVMPNERGRRDKYYTRYVGREYDGAPLEVLTMSIETVIADDAFISALLADDLDTVRFAVGLLARWRFQ